MAAAEATGNKRFMMNCLKSITLTSLAGSLLIIVTSTVSK